MDMSGKLATKVTRMHKGESVAAPGAFFRQISIFSLGEACIYKLKCKAILFRNITRTYTHEETWIKETQKKLNVCFWWFFSLG